MANTVIQVTQTEIEKMKSYYAQYLKTNNPPGSVFSAKKQGCTITAYRSGKVMFQGTGNEAEAKQWGGALPTKKAAPAKKKSSGIPLPSNISSLSVIGSDEVGKGDYFGPLTVVATYVKKEQIPLVKELGVQDSKNLSDVEIVKIAKDLITFLPYSLLTLPNEKYNQLQSSGMTQGKITARLHNQALNYLLKKIEPEKPDAILVDQFAEAPVYYRHLQGVKEICRENVYFSTKAESIHLSVAAASILARYAFLKAMDQLSQKAGFKLTKGAGPKVDQDAARLIQIQGIQALNTFTKTHFANTEKAKKIAGI
ncbi:ribonuclease HIII [Lederbergia galactosidilytica]|uniref:Ribonuclease HIII n=1 Tax=Lederbergia galactosidilytica TaxID=217031 RepID=A0A177ZJZ2_9BACI|nr:ribonuclease HIII [Lederbergia galactosidilytica]KRG14475.1 ribonuclease HIII [Virgibacillus soli]MBP1915011.1 ribonuclease HIII [Lederbergia galactosidilytica]OAK68262.1 ribonuclease HIII [Lederbergia galactosidilytica]